MKAAEAREIEALLGVKRSRPALDPSATDDQPVTSLAVFGFPALYGTTIFLSAAAIDSLWDRAEIALPPVCCVCAAPVTARLPTCLLGGLAARLRRSTQPGPLGPCVPHCATHARGPCAQLVVRCDGWSRETTTLSFAGWSASFLNETVAINRRGEPLPPWRAFPALAPESSGWRQGNGEHWWRQAWAPYWSRLHRGSAVDYLARWGAPDEWRARLLTD